MDSTTIAVDVAKAVFEVAVSAHPGPVRERHRFSRERFRRSLGEQSPPTILMEACGSGHYWGRQALAHGHQVVLLPPHTVRPYGLRNKTDRSDAQGLPEAVRNDEVRPVPVKSETQPAVAALHRLRSTGLAPRPPQHRARPAARVRRGHPDRRPSRRALRRGQPRGR